MTATVRRRIRKWIDVRVVEHRALSAILGKAPDQTPYLCTVSALFPPTSAPLPSDLTATPSPRNRRAVHPHGAREPEGETQGFGVDIRHPQREAAARRGISESLHQ
jgi:hypothetical protein